MSKKTKTSATKKAARTRKSDMSNRAAKARAAAKNATPAADKPMSGLDAAAKVLADAGEPMRARALVGAMAERGLWKSPGGKTPWATIYAAMTREIAAKGDGARFHKTDRGQFAFNG